MFLKGVCHCKDFMSALLTQVMAWPQTGNDDGVPWCIQSLAYPKIITYPTHTIMQFLYVYIEYRRKVSTNSLAWLVILLAPGHWAMGYMEPWYICISRPECDKLLLYDMETESIWYKFYEHTQLGSTSFQFYSIVLFYPIKLPGWQRFLFSFFTDPLNYEWRFMSFSTC